jgi:peptidoglycan/LPS O-acetylase OafA/YrhL
MHALMQLKSLETIRATDRISSVDVFRGFAILPVVVYHFNGMLPYGYFGVDLFFVISGLLVGGILIRKFRRNEEINFWRFVLQRGFKIWPSYYWFLLIGTLAAHLFYSQSKPEYIISGHGWKDARRYVLFFQNYTGPPFHWPFDHVWSLCVEEHFYILLPLIFITIVTIFKRSERWLLLSIAGLIVGGVTCKILSIHFTNSKDTYAGTHNRIDALGWGVFLAALVTYYDERLRKIRHLHVLFVVGALLFATNLALVGYWPNYYFQKVVAHSIAPFCFFLMLLGIYYRDFSRWKAVRFVAYYSYNWYLWHPLFVLLVSKHFGARLPGLVVYVAISFLVAVLFTVFIEETFLKMRDPVLSKLHAGTHQ